MTCACAAAGRVVNALFAMGVFLLQSQVAQFQVSPARLRTDTAAIAIAAIAIAVALAAFAVFLIRRNRTDRTMLWFAIFAVLYGARILLGAPVFTAGFRLTRQMAETLSAAITL